MTRFGVVLPQHDAGPEALLGAARLAEDSGLDSVWVSDHLWGFPGGPTRPVLEGWTCLASAASVTSSITIGTLVTRVTLRPPRTLGAMAETVARIAPRRLVLGLGIADAPDREEQTAYDIAFAPRAERLRILEATIELLRSLVPEVPLWVGGASDQILAIAAACDGWNFWGPPDEFPRHRERLAAKASGLPPETSWAGSYPGTARLERLIGAGCDHVIVAVGAGNFHERIPRVAAVRERLGGQK